MAASKKSAYLFDDGYNTAKDVEAYASSLNIDLDTAAHQLSLQELAGDLDAELSRKEADTYAGLWIQHSPQFRIIVQFTKEGEKTIRPYIENGTLADYVETRIVEYTLKELEAAQVATQLEIRKIDFPTNSGINLVENRVELYVVERSRFDVAMQETKMQLAPQVRVVTVSELAAEQNDIYAGLRLVALDLRDCTSGFSVIEATGVKGILTAAHCSNAMSYDGIDLPFQGSAYGGPCDFQWHTAPGFDVRNLMYDGTNLRYVLWTKHRDNQAVGQWVCKYGWASGFTCGFISDKNYYPGGDMDNTLIRVHQDGVNLSSGGDSGGPWFRTNTAYGLHVGEIGDDAYYMAINYIEVLGLRVLTPYRVFLPLVIFHDSTNLEYGSAYPPPEDEGTSITTPSSPEPYPFP
jgi:hypothetical protein